MRKDLLMRKFNTVPLADGENPRKHRLGRGSDLIAEGVAGVGRRWPAGRWPGLFGKQ